MGRKENAENRPARIVNKKTTLEILIKMKIHGFHGNLKIKYRTLVRCALLPVLLAGTAAFTEPGPLHAPPVAPGELARTGMTNVGEVLELKPFGASYKAAIDPVAGFAYFGAAGPIDPSILAKIDLHGRIPKLVKDGAPNPISKGMVAMLGVEVDTSDPDPLKHFIYCGMASGQILKFAPGGAHETPRLISTLQSKSAAGTIMCSAIDLSSPDPNQHYVYFGINVRGTARKILRVRLSDFTDQGAETINIRSIRYCAIDPVHHYAYFTSFDNSTKVKEAPQISKVNLGTFHDGGGSVATYTLDSTEPSDGVARAGSDYPSFDQGFVIDPVHACGYIGTYNCDQAKDHPKADTWPYNQAMVARMQLGTGDNFPAHPVSVLNLRVGERDLAAAVIDLTHGNVYFGTDNCYPGHVYMIHVGDGTSPMEEVGRLDLQPGSLKQYPRDGDTVPGNPFELDGESYLRTAVIDEKHDAIYFGTDSEPGQVIKVGINGK